MITAHCEQDDYAYSRNICMLLQPLLHLLTYLTYVGDRPLRWRPAETSKNLILSKKHELYYRMGHFILR